jgi:hypothetical protein
MAASLSLNASLGPVSEPPAAGGGPLLQLRKARASKNERRQTHFLLLFRIMSHLLSWNVNSTPPYIVLPRLG